MLPALIAAAVVLLGVGSSLAAEARKPWGISGQQLWVR